MTDFKIDNNSRKLTKIVKKLELRRPNAEISKRTGFDAGTVSNYLNGKKTVSDNFLEKLSEVYNFNLSDFDDNVEVKTESQQITGFYYPEVSASAGLETQIENNDLKKIPVTIPGWDKEISFINVYGDSMYPKYNAGEIIGVKYIDFDYLNYGSSYVVVFKNGDSYIKIIQPGSSLEHLILESVNEFYKPKEYHLDLIKSFYSIKGVIKKEMM